MGIRTIVRKLRKPAVMALVAGSLVLSLTVTTTQRAEATPAIAIAPVIAAAEAIVGGAALPFTMPSLLATSLALHPVGWAIAAVGAVIGVGLWATQDYWLPWAQEVGAGMWGAAVGADPSRAPAAGAPVWPGFTYSSVKKINNEVWQIDGSKAATSGTTWFGQIAVLSCKNRQTGAITKRSFNNASAWGAGAAGVMSWQIYCGQTSTGGNATYEDVVGGSVGAAGADPIFPAPCPGSTSNVSCRYPGPANIFSWGDQVGVAQPAFDPKGADVKYKTTVECIEANGVKSTLTAESVGDEGGVKVPSCAAAGKGHGTGKMSVDGYAPTAPGMPGTTPTPLWSSPAPTVAPDHPQKLCDPNRPGDGCKMAITIDGKPCVVGSWDCENWTEIWKDPATAPRVGCTYGPYAMAVDLCTVMEPAYRPGGAPANEPNTDGNPDTRNYTQPGGTTYAPPSTGTGTVPGLGGQPGPGASPSEAQCFPQGWAMLNPVEWVMKPVGCALAAAFVPNPATVQARTNSIQTKFQNVGFARVTTAWLSTFEAAGGGSGCSGPTVNFNMSGVNQTLQPFNACSAPMSTVAGVSYGVSAIAMVLFGGLGIARAIAAGFGFNFSMGKGSDA